MTLYAKASHFEGGEQAAIGALVLDEEGEGWRVLHRDAGWLTLERASDYDTLRAHEENVRRSKEREATRHLRDPRIVAVDSRIRDYERELRVEYPTVAGACCSDCVYGSDPRYGRLKLKIERAEKWRGILAEKLRKRLEREKVVASLDEKREAPIRRTYDSV